MPDTELPPAPSRAPLYAVMPPEGQVTIESLLDGFLAYCAQRGLSLYPAQEEAILELFDGKSVILNTPTGSGKSLVALAAHWKAVADGGRSFYTAPIKALVSEKFFELCEAFGPENVGMMTGDASINRDASVICCTAEILSNLALREGDQADLDMVVIDEFHFYSERDRGVAWQVPLLTLPQARFLLMSATLGDTARFEESIAELTGAPVALVKTMDRPVPLDWEYSEKPLHETLLAQLESKKTPIYVVHFAQRAASEHAQDLMSIDFLSKDDKAAIKQELTGFRWDTPFGAELRRFVHHGVGVHHAGMLPKYRRVVERLAGKGLLKIICGTDTLGVGVNIPLRTVVFTKLCKYDGDKTKILTVRDFHQIAGRAGRKGFDTQGTVIVQAPEHVIENKIAQQKATGDAKKLRKWKPSKPPERGYAHWDEQTFQKLRDGEPERLVSRFAVSHGMMLNVFTRPDGCTAMKRLIRASHDAPVRQRQHGRHALAILRSLIKADIVALRRGGVDLNADLQTDFSLNQALSLYVVEAVEALDRENGDYALNLVSLVEATLEDPSAVLFKQVDTLKGRAVASLKAQGVEYDERMAELEKIEAPKPNAEFMLGTFRMFAEHHPWVGSDSLRLKSVARDMFEQGETFNGYVRTYGLARAEGVLLRYLSDVYKALIQTIPEDAEDQRARRHHRVAGGGHPLGGRQPAGRVGAHEARRGAGRARRRRGAAGRRAQGRGRHRQPQGLPRIGAQRDLPSRAGAGAARGALLPGHGADRAGAATAARGRAGGPHGPLLGGVRRAAHRRRGAWATALPAGRKQWQPMAGESVAAGSRGTPRVAPAPGGRPVGFTR
jgi:superfamily II RNA helicase